MRINVWGGFGSQLYGLNLFFILSDKFPKKNFVLRFHTSGVTKRNLEIQFDRSKNWKTKIEQIDDFYSFTSKKLEKVNMANQFLPSLYRLFKKILIKMKIINEIEYYSDLENVRPWTLNIRGHYSYLPVNSFRINKIMEVIGIDGIHSDENEHFQICTGLHLRLGDLLTLSEKSPVPKLRLIRVLNKILGNTDRKALVHIFSDSKEKISEYFEGSDLSNLKIVGETNTAIQTIKHLSVSTNFIGTTAKISIWIALTRLFVTNKQSFLPIELKDIIEANYFDFSELYKINFY